MRLPPLNALRAFEAAARHASFLHAAQELNVTPAAISHQIKTLEGFLGVSLFRRLARGVDLTDSGRELLPEITRGFAHFGRGIGSVSGGMLSGLLTVTVLPSLAHHWLLPRLSGFLDAFPDINVRVQSSGARQIDFKEDADLRIWFGLGDYPGYRSVLLMTDEIFPVCAPALLNRHPLRTFADLKHHRLLQDINVDQLERTMTWRQWLKEAGSTLEAEGKTVEFNDSALLTHAAVHGQGVALGRRSLVREYLRTGRLTRLFKETRASEYSYYTVTTEEKAEHPRVKVFVNWLEEQVRLDRERD